MHTKPNGIKYELWCLEILTFILFCSELVKIGTCKNTFTDENFYDSFALRDSNHFEQDVKIEF